MVVGHHLVWTAYGTWLPNDPRGSSSHEIRMQRIADLGELHHGRKRVQPLPAEIRAFYDEARGVLTHPILTFTARDVQVLADSIATVISDNTYTCYGCAIMWDHVHIQIRRHRDDGKVMLERFQEHSKQALIDAGRRPPDHPVWGGNGWDRYLNTKADMERIARYIRENPIKAKRPAQNWPFVKPYNGWLPRPAKSQLH